MIRKATIDDAERLLEIYAYYVKNTAITFEYDVPSLEEFTNRIYDTLKKNIRILSLKMTELYKAMPMQEHLSAELHMTIPAR